MSNVINRIKKKLKASDMLYNSPIGSCISTIAILTEHTEGEARLLFNKMRKLGSRLPCHTIREICDYIYAQWGYTDDKPFSDQIVLVWDEMGVRSPMVSFLNSGNLMPIDPNGFHEINILSLAAQGRDWAKIEFVYEEDDDVSES